MKSNFIQNILLEDAIRNGKDIVINLEMGKLHNNKFKKVLKNEHLKE